MSAAATWVVGSGGLLRTSVTSELLRRGAPVYTSAVPWGDYDQARSVLLDDARCFMQATAGRPWQVAWCAGVGVNGTSESQFAAENSMLRDVLDELPTAAGSAIADGTFFHASSAGAVYAGTAGAPHDEGAMTNPLGDYGRAKLAAEATVADFARGSGATAVIGRISNLFGPGQNLAKPQGLITHLCRGHLLGAPVSIYVSMDTLRDYLFVTDAGEMVADSLALAAANRGDVTTKILASGRSITIATILSACRTVFRRKPQVVLAASPLSSFQGRDLRLHSIVWPELDRRSHRSLIAGVGATLEGTRRTLARWPVPEQRGARPLSGARTS